MKKHDNRIVLAVIFAVSYIILVNLISLAVCKILSVPDGSFLPSLVTKIISTVMIIVFLVISKKISLLKSEKGSFIKGIGAGMYELFVILLSAAANILKFEDKQLKPLPEIVYFILLMILVGISEELIFRGIVFDYIHDVFGSDTKSGAYLTAAVSGGIFGFMHLFNLIGSEVPAAILFQAIGAAAVGFFYGAVYLRCRNIWVVICMHALSDFSAMLTNGFLAEGTIRKALDSHSGFVLIGAALYISIGIFLLRSEKMSYSPKAATFTPELEI